MVCEFTTEKRPKGWVRLPGVEERVHLGNEEGRRITGWGEMELCFMQECWGKELEWKLSSKEGAGDFKKREAEWVRMKTEEVVQRGMKFKEA